MTVVSIRFPEELLRQVDSFLVMNLSDGSSRADAIRTLVERGLGRRRGKR